MSDDRETARLEQRLVELQQQLEDRQREFDQLSMEMALSISELFLVVSKLIAGDFSVRAPEQSPIELFAKFGATVNTAINQLEANTEQLRQANIKLRREVVERKRAEEAARLLSSVVEQSAVGIAITDLDGVLTFANAAFARMHGYEPQEIIGESLKLIHPPQASPLVTQVVEQLLAHGEYKEEHHHLRADGSPFPALVHNSLLRDAAGEPAGMIIDVRDITEHKQMENELIRAEKLESLGILAGGIAHDFNNFLLAIMGNLSLIKQRLDPESDEHRRLAEAEKSCLTARGLTQQLLTFSRGGAPVKETTPIAELIRETAEFTLSGTNVRCVFDLATDLWPARVDAGQISQVVNNLVLNAQQAMAGGGTLTISATNLSRSDPEATPAIERDQLRLTIADQGPGIDPETLSKIFDPFFTTKEGGSGLGLATAYSIIRNHGGRFEVQSEPGSGTTFQIYLPATRSPTPTPVPDPSRSASLGYSVLLMDDDDAVRKVVGDLLRSIGCRVTLARDGQEAIEIYQLARKAGEPFDVLILDLTVPAGMGGQEVVAELRQIDPQVRAVVSSGYSTDPVMANYSEYGFMGVVSKPYRLAELRKVLERVVGD